MKPKSEGCPSQKNVNSGKGPNKTRSSTMTIEQKLSRLADELAANRYNLVEMKERNSKLEKRNAALESESSALRSEINTIRIALAARSRRLKRSKREILGLRNSTSWIVTRPMRLVKHLALETILLALERISRGRLTFATREKPSRLSLPAMKGMSRAEVERVMQWFDQDFYLARYPDVRSCGIEPIEHYLSIGWREGRDPSPLFSTEYYRHRWPVLESEGINPFLHWIFHGMREKRPGLPYWKRLEVGNYAPKVSAIVPNYNHARYLRQRIESILRQTYQNLEILVLDDCSSDESRAVIEEYRMNHPDKIRALYNVKNSGSVFHQWHSGVKNSTGELVWICESDDFCKFDFLEKLVPYFIDRSVNIAFGRIQFTDGDGNLKKGLDRYREGAEPGIWATSLVRPARQWFANGFGVNNVIANVGGCLWRRQLLSEQVWRDAETFGVLGDWFLYTQISGGGQIAWEPAAIAYFRQHDRNSSVTSFVKATYYEEHERLMLLLRRFWDVPDETVEKFCQKVSWQYSHHQLEEKLGPIERYFNKVTLLSARRTRPHILMAFLGFQPGGGEVFPINLANELHAQGHLVSMMALDMKNLNLEMLAGLDSAIPVYDAAWVEEYGADRFLADGGISLIHSHMLSLERFFFEKCRIGSKIPYVVSLHGSYEVGGLTDDKLWQITRGVTHFVYTADKNLKPLEALRRPHENFTKLSNAVAFDPLPFPQNRKELRISPNALVFTLVARGIKRKGWRAALSAFCQLRSAHPEREMHLLLCGNGEEPDLYREIYGADPHITFLGYQSRIHGLYRLSDVAIVPTRFEGESFPLCIIQALQAGTPVIATRIGQIETMIAPPGQSPAGVLIEPERDTELFTGSLQGAMATMLSRSKRMNFASAARKLGQAYSIGRVAREYVQLYNTILEPNSPPNPVFMGQEAEAAQLGLPATGATKASVR